jgi:tetratricopeptide (TPR) repeat protein
MAWLDQVREWLGRAGPADRFSVGRSYARQKRYAEAARVFSPLLDLPLGAFGGNAERYAEMMREIGRCAFELGRYDEADGILRRGLIDFGVTRKAPALLVELARCASAKGQTQQMHEHLEAAWRVQREHDAESAEPVALDPDGAGGEGPPRDSTAGLAAEIARVLADAGADRSAIRYWRRARLRYERAGNSSRLIWALHHEAKVLNAMERFGAAADACLRALSVTPIGRRNARRAAGLWIALTQAQVNDGRYLAAGESLKQARASTLLMPDEEQALFNALGEATEGLLCCEQGKYASAVSAFERALHQRGQCEMDRWAEGLALNNVVYARAKCGRIADCEELIARAVELLGDTPEEAYALHTRAVLAHATGDPAGAEQWLAKAMAVRARSRRRLPAAGDWELLAEWKSAAGDWLGAADAYGQAATVLRRKLRANHPKRLDIEQKAPEARSKAGA